MTTKVSVGVAATLVLAAGIVAVRRARQEPPAPTSPSAPSVASSLAPPAPGDGAQGEAAVRALFDAIDKKDCERFTLLAAGEIAIRLKDKSCKGLFDDYAEHKFRLIRTEGSEPDGRSPSTARMVKIRIAYEKGERAGLARVEKVDGVWKVAAY